jgi:hypothetical protein
MQFQPRFKDGKEHRYWSIVENRRCGRGKIVQRQVLYLGEINDTQRQSWCRTIEVFDENRGIAVENADAKNDCWTQRALEHCCTAANIAINQRPAVDAY